jgi:Ca-activated chloride channel family protein
MANKPPDYYEVLGISRDATLKEIRRAYHQAAQKLHPDKNEAPGDTEIFLEVQQAFEVLSNVKRRTKYDATLPPREAPQPLILHEVYFSRPNLVELDEPQMIYLLLEIWAHKQTDKFQMPPLNVALVLDRSTSMQGEKMDMVKSAASQILKGLRNDDILSVVAFSDKAEVIVSSTAQADRRQMETSIYKMQPSGATEILQGLEAGMQEVLRGVDAGKINHIILLTDGHTYGDEQGCLRLAEKAAAQGIGISGMGIGADWNDVFLDALANRTGGSSTYIARAQDIAPFLIEKFKALSNTFANDVLLELSPQEGIELTYGFRLEPESGPVQSEKSMRLGPVPQDSPLSVLFEFVIQPGAVGRGSVNVLDGSLNISPVSRTQTIPPVRLKLAREVDSRPTSDVPPTKIMDALARLALYRLHERARRQSDAGDYDEASLSLRSLASNLLAHGEPQLARTALLEAENVERLHQWSSVGGKAIKYSTRGLLYPQTKETTK